MVTKHQSLSPWVLVAGGFHNSGGMDKANAALATYLINKGVSVHLIGYYIDEEFLNHPLVTTYIVKQIAKSFLISEFNLNKYGKIIINNLRNKFPKIRVLVNGGNCSYSDINWVHYVHHADSLSNEKAPVWFKVKNYISNFIAKTREKRIITNSRIILANSERTKKDLIKYLNISHNRIHTVYLGNDTPQIFSNKRLEIREKFGQSKDHLLAAFVGAIGYDNRKGFDTLLLAWKELCKDPSWKVTLLVAGGGRNLSKWQTKIAQAGLENKIKFLGFINWIPDLLSAVDLLISPVRYEAYGLNVQEAICQRIPAIVSKCAGIGERYPSELEALLLNNPESVSELIQCLRNWYSKLDYYKAATKLFSDKLCSYTWEHMAEKIVEIVKNVEI